MRLWSKELAVMSAFAVAVTAIYLLVAYNHGALGAARNDDWVYYRALAKFHQNGFFRPDPFTDTMLIGQLVAFRPLFALVGNNLAAFQIAVAAIGAVGLVAAYALLRRFLTVAQAAMSIVVLALGPIFGAVGTTFMTDVPGFTLQVFCLLLGARALEEREPDNARLVLALLVGLIAFSFREYAAAASLTVLAVAFVRTWKGSWRSRLTVVGLGVVWLALAATLFVWRKSLGADAGRNLVVDVVPNVTDVAQLSRMWFTISLFVAPALAFIKPRTVIAAWSRHRILASLVVAALAVAWAALFSWAGTVLLGNYVVRITPYAISLWGESPAVVSWLFWLPVQIVSGLAAAVIAVLGVYGVGLVIRRFPLERMTRGGNRSAASLALVYGVFTLGLLGVVNVSGVAALFDRYLLSIVAFVAGWLIYAFGVRRLSPSQKIGGGVALAAYAVLGLTIIDAAAIFDGARWRIAQMVQARGYPAEVIDAGYEWYGYHHRTEIAHGETAPGDGWWLSLFDDPAVCVVVSMPDKAGKHVGQENGRLVVRYTPRGLFGAAYDLQAWEVRDKCPDPTT